MPDDTRKTKRLPPDITAPHVVLRPDYPKASPEPRLPVVSILVGGLLVMVALCAIVLVVWQLISQRQGAPAEGVPPPPIALIATQAPTPEPLPEYGEVKASAVIYGSIIEEREKALRILDPAGERSTWIPKSAVKKQEDSEFTLHSWFIEKVEWRDAG